MPCRILTALAAVVGGGVKLWHALALCCWSTGIFQRWCPCLVGSINRGGPDRRFGRSAARAQRIDGRSLHPHHSNAFNPGPNRSTEPAAVVVLLPTDLDMSKRSAAIFSSNVAASAVPKFFTALSRIPSLVSAAPWPAADMAN